MNALFVFLGGGIGSLTRYGIGLLIGSFYTQPFPLGTLISNVLSCILLAFITVGFADKVATFNWIQPLLIVGFCGGFSTFSTFSAETVTLLQSGNYWIALLNVLVSLLTGIGLVYLVLNSPK